MFFIFGLTARNKTIGSGTFFCPREGGDRHYEHKQARRFFSLFFIPLIPMKELGEYIECDSCQNTYDPDVLKGKTSADIEDLSTLAVRHLAVSMVLADGVVDPLERDAAVTVVQRFASHPYDARDLDRDLESLAVASLTDHLEELGAILNAHGRENVLTAAVFLAGADGDIDRYELEVARQIGKALTMSSAHVEGTIQQELARLGLHL